MPKIDFPRSDKQRLIHLSQLGNRLGQPSQANQLPADLYRDVFAEKASFELAAHYFAEAQRLRSEALRHRNNLLDRLKKIVRNFVARLRNTVTFSESNLVFLSYNLHPTRNPTAYKDPIAWCAWATDLIIGEQRQIALGREPINAPSQWELASLRDQTKVALLAFAKANRAKQAAGIVLAKRRPLLTALLRRLAAYLQYRLKGEPKAVRTAYFRSMGYRFVTPGSAAELAPSQAVVTSTPKQKPEQLKAPKQAWPQRRNSQTHTGSRMLLNRNVPCKIKMAAHHRSVSRPHAPNKKKTFPCVSQLQQQAS